MYRQMSVFDFIENPGTEEPEYEPVLPPKTLFQELFNKIDNPVIRCANCLCNYCSNNAEELWRKVKPQEMRNICLNCDSCRAYTGKPGHFQDKMDCSNFVISDYASKRIRNKFKVVE